MSTQQEKIHLHFALTQLVSSDQGSLLQHDEIAVNKVQLQCCWMKDSNIVFTYTLKLGINKTAESFSTGINAYIFVNYDRDKLRVTGGILIVLALCRVLIKHQAPNMYFQMCAILLLLDKLCSVRQST